jgi:ABC-type Zn uptake system ZnuABC Zn-binding protein ZnuA
MTRSFLRLFLIIAIASGFLHCDESDSIHEAGQNTAASIFPVFDMIRQITGQEAGLFYTVPPGANPHDYEPVPSLVRKLKNIDLFFGIHPDFDGWITSYLPSSAKIVWLYRELGISAPGEEKDDQVSPQESHDHDGGVVNPHIWLSPVRAVEITRIIENTLSGRDSTRSPLYHERALAYRNKLEKMHKDFDVLFQSVKVRSFIQWHPAWDYFSEEYGLEIAGTMEKGHGHTPSVKHIQNLVMKARQEGIRIVVVGLNVNSPTAEALAREIDGSLVRLDAIGDPGDPLRATYLDLMMFNASRLAEALGVPESELRNILYGRL